MTNVLFFDRFRRASCTFTARRIRSVFRGLLSTQRKNCCDCCPRQKRLILWVCRLHHILQLLLETFIFPNLLSRPVFSRVILPCILKSLVSIKPCIPLLPISFRIPRRRNKNLLEFHRQAFPFAFSLKLRHHFLILLVPLVDQSIGRSPCFWQSSLSMLCLPYLVGVSTTDLALNSLHQRIKHNGNQGSIHLIHTAFVLARQFAIRENMCNGICHVHKEFFCPR